MPRKARVDTAGALHHIIVRRIERRKIFDDDHDRDSFLIRLAAVLEDTGTGCYAWTLIPNHFHLLLRTGSVPIATVMRRLLTGHATSYNRRHHRSGHLFQNRYKSILCQEALDRRYALKAEGVSVADVSERVAQVFAINPDEVWLPGKYQRQVTARSLLCFWAVNELGETMTAMATRLGVSTAAVSKSVRRGAKIAKAKGLKFRS